MRQLAALLLSLLTISASHAQQSSNVKLLCNWNDTTLCPVNGGGQHWNDVWGFVNKGKEYAVIGGTSGGHVIDIDACEQRAYLPSKSTGVIHRDYKTYKHYLYAVADEGLQSALQVWDYSYLPDSMHLVFESQTLDFNRAHNIFIDTARGKLYCGSETDVGSGQHKLTVYTLAKPEIPEWIVDIDDFDKAHDIYVRNDTVWYSNSWSGYLMLETKNLPAYRVLGGLTFYPYKGYNHSSWIGYDGIGVMADETFGMPLKVIDTRTPAVMEVLSTFSPRGLDTTSVPHNPYLLGHYAFISYYMDGLQIYDLTDPKNPVQAGFYDTYPGPDEQKYAGAWGCFPYLPSKRILVSDMQTGLYVLDANQILGVDGPATATTVQVYPNPADNSINIQFPSTISGRLDYTIYDMTGAVVLRSETGVFTKAYGPLSLPLPASLAPGLYMLRAAIGGQSFTTRFTKR